MNQLSLEDLLPDLVARVDMDLAVSLGKLARGYDESEWTCLCAQRSLFNMVAQAQLLRRTIHAIHPAMRPSLGGIYRSALLHDGRSFALRFWTLFLLWEESVTGVDSSRTMPENSA